MAYTNADKARDDALARMLQLRAPGDFRRDGADLILEAMDDADFRRSVAKLMRACIADGGEDHAELGRMVWERIVAYAESCPGFQDAVSSELVDQQTREVA